jgi:hypothetical protein
MNGIKWIWIGRATQAGNPGETAAQYDACCAADGTGVGEHKRVVSDLKTAAAALQNSA